MSLDMTLGVTPDTVDVLQPKTGVVNHPNAIQPQKFIVITGGTVSGVGKGTTISCIGVILKSMGFNVTAIKIDPYLNVDAGTMSPYEHGEVYVLEDGGEVDLDLGNYERFLDITLTRDHNITTGKVYEKVLRDERGGRYLGKTVQLIPHVTNTIQEWIRRVAQIPVSPQRPGRPDICLVEVGGTVGDIESLSYLEALQQFYMSIGDKNFCLCHVSYIPEIGSGISREQKTKPTQNSIKELRKLGLRPDFIFCRSENVLSQKAKDKISLLGQAPLQNIIDVHNVPNIFFAPSMIDQQGFGLSVCEKFGLIPSQSYLESRNKVFSPLPNMINPLVGQDFCGYSVSKLEQLGNSMQSIERIINVGIVGKYTGSEDSYLSVIRAIQHAALVHNVHPKISWINSSDLEDPKNEEAWETLRNCHGIVCPGGFGDRGIPGKMASSRYCRMNNVPYLGICLGMQAAVIEFCRSELGLIHADSEEFNKDAPDKVVVFMPEIHSTTKGGTMRLGNRATIIRDPNSFAFRIYGAKPVIYERHRHRYEVNSLYVPVMESKGLMFVGQDEKGQRMEIAELQNHIFFLLTQYHPEFTSRIFRPNPCFLALIEACCTRIK